MFERGGVDHLHDDIRRRKRRGRTLRFVQRNGRALVAPQQVFQRRAVVRLEVVRRKDARQVDHACFVQSDLHRAFVIGALRPGKGAGLDRGARDRRENRALAAVGQAHERNAQPALAAEQRLAQGNPRDMGGRLRHQGNRAGGPVPVYLTHVEFISQCRPMPSPSGTPVALRFASGTREYWHAARGRSSGTGASS